MCAFLAVLRKVVAHCSVISARLAVGHNILGETVKRLCKDAEIEGQFTNHSLRATTATRALKKGIPDKFVMQRTGHRDVRSLQLQLQLRLSFQRLLTRVMKPCHFLVPLVVKRRH